MEDEKKKLLNVLIVVTFLLIGAIIIVHSSLFTVNTGSLRTPYKHYYITTNYNNNNNNNNEKYNPQGTPVIVYTNSNTPSDRINTGSNTKLIIMNETTGTFLRNKGTSIIIKEGYFLLNNKLITPGTTMTLETPGTYKFYNYRNPSKSVEVIIN